MIPNGCRCQRCGKIYKVDWIVPDEVWKRISPNGEESGLLCGACIASLIESWDEFGMFDCETDSYGFMADGGLK